MNNKGFAITTILYGTLILFLMLFVSMLGILSTYKDRLSMLIDSNNGARCIINGNCGDDSIAYAVFSVDDYSLRFYKTTNVITTGSKYNGLTATAVYTGFEQRDSSAYPLWYDYQGQIEKVIVEDVIIPVNTSSWFQEMRYCELFDLEKLDTSNVHNMSTMFGRASSSVSSLELIGLEYWDTSNVTDMSSMFDDFGAYVEYSLDLSGWNVRSVTTYDRFEDYVEDKIISPWD